MQTANINGVELAYDEYGEGEPMLIMHGAIWADFLRPLATQPALADFRRIRYHRRGYGDSSRPGGGFDANAADAMALLDHLDIDSAHLVGHSEGAMIAMEVGAAYPERVQSLVLLEPLAPPSWAATSDYADIFEAIGSAIGAAVGRYQVGDIEGAYDTIFESQGLDWRAAAEAVGPGVLEQGIRDAATFVEVEATDIFDWSFGPEQAAVINCPVLLWGSAPLSPIGVAVRTFLHEMFPQCEEALLEGADHLSPGSDPTPVAESIAPFVSKHARTTATT